MKYLFLLYLLFALSGLYAQITFAQVDDFTGQYTVQSKRTTFWHNTIAGESFLISFASEDGIYYANIVWASRQVNKTDYVELCDLLYLKLSGGQIIKAQPIGKFYARTFKTLFSEKQYLSAQYEITKTDFNLIRAYSILKLRFTFFDNLLSIDISPTKSSTQKAKRNAEATWILTERGQVIEQIIEEK